MFSKTLFAALIAIGLAAGLAAAAPAPNSPDASAPAAAVPKTVWQVGADGAALHLESQLQCPTTVGEFHRTGLSVLGPFGLDVACDYRNADQDNISLFVALRGAQSLAQQFDAAKAALVQRLPDATPLADGEQQMFTATRDWQHLIYRLNAASRTGVFMARIANWNVEYRATFVASRTDATLSTMAALTETVEKTAGQHITSCASLTPLQRQGRKIVNQSMFPALSISGTLAAQSLRENASSAPPNWCIIQPIMIEGVRFLFWRNAANQTSGMVERLTPLAENDPVTVIGIVDAMGPQMIKTGEMPTLAYDIVLDTPDSIQLVGVYEGRPPIGELVRLAQRRTVGMYGKIDKKDGKTDIYKAPL